MASTRISLIRGPEGEKGDAGDMGPAGPNTVPTQQAVADALTTPGSVAEAAVAAKIQTAIDELPDVVGDVTPTAIIPGDSIAAQNGGPRLDATPTVDPYNYFQARGPVVQGLILAKQPLVVLSNAGVGGERDDQIAARFASQVVARKPGVAIIASCGTNGVSQGRSVAQIAASFVSMFNAAKEAGIKVFVSTVTTQAGFAGAVTSASRAINDTTVTVAGITTPNGSVSIPVPGAATGHTLRIDTGSNAEDVTVTGLNVGTGTYTVSPLTKAHAAGAVVVNKTLMAVLGGVNAWLDAYCRKNPGVILVDTNAVYADPVTGGPGAGMAIDGTHPSLDGAIKLGKAWGDAFDRELARPTKGRVTVNDPTNLSPNPTMAGTAGAFAAWASSSGQIATGFTFYGNTGAESVVASKVARTDGLPGEMQQLAITGGTTGTLNYQTATLSLASLGLAVGDLVWAEMEFEGDDMVVASGNGTPFSLSIQWVGGSGTAPISAQTSSASDGQGAFWPAKGRHRTQAAPIPSGTTGIRLVASIHVASGVCRLGQNRIVKGAIA